jgi:hypothetical protein
VDGVARQVQRPAQIMMKMRVCHRDTPASTGTVGGASHNLAKFYSCKARKKPEGNQVEAKRESAVLLLVKEIQGSYTTSSTHVRFRRSLIAAGRVPATLFPLKTSSLFRQQQHQLQRWRNRYRSLRGGVNTTSNFKFTLAVPAHPSAGSQHQAVRRRLLDWQPASS